MRKKLVLFLTTALFCLSVLAGCSKDTADAYAGKKITTLKEEKSDDFALLLEEGIAESNDTYVLQFPEELKAPYREFLQEAFKSMDFEVQKAKKNGSGNYHVKISFKPLDLTGTTEHINDAHAEGLASADLTAEVTALLKEDTKAIQKKPKFSTEILATLEVTEKDDGFAISDEALKGLLEQALLGYMDPYNKICELLDAQDFMQAYLDASFKGEVTQFAKHTDRTEDEALAWYEEDVFDPPSDLTSDYAERYKNGLKALMKQCKYTVGIPKKEKGVYNYTLDITYTPNNSMVNVLHEIENGTYYSMNAVSKAFVEKIEKYASAPAYGAETTMTIPLNITAINTSGADGSEYQKLANAIFPFL